MRGFYLVLVLFLSSCKAQQHAPSFTMEELEWAKNHPFEVLYAESYQPNNDQETSGWHILNRNDTIKLTKGYLLLAHYSGEIMEFEGDTILSINNLQQARDTIDYPEIFNSRFLVDPSAEISRSRYPTFGHYYYSIYYTIAIPSQNSINPTEPLCLSWVGNRSDYDSIPYRIQVKNVYEDILSEQKIDGTSIKLELGKMSNEIGDGFYLIELSEYLDPENKAPTIAFKLEKDQIPLNTCLQDRAIDHLQRAVHYERILQDERSRFEYKKAAELSDREIYQDILTNFLNRD